MLSRTLNHFGVTIFLLFVAGCTVTTYPFSRIGAPFDRSTVYLYRLTFDQLPYSVEVSASRESDNETGARAVPPGPFRDELQPGRFLSMDLEPGTYVFKANYTSKLRSGGSPLRLQAWTNTLSLAAEHDYFVRIDARPAPYGMEQLAIVAVPESRGMREISACRSLRQYK